MVERDVIVVLLRRAGLLPPPLLLRRPRRVLPPVQSGVDGEFRGRGASVALGPFRRSSPAPARKRLDPPRAVVHSDPPVLYREGQPLEGEGGRVLGLGLGLGLHLPRPLVRALPALLQAVALAVHLDVHDTQLLREVVLLRLAGRRRRRRGGGGEPPRQREVAVPEVVVQRGGARRDGRGRGGGVSTTAAVFLPALEVGEAANPKPAVVQEAAGMASMGLALLPL
mmetsp:Transcript_8096/g.19825  ORF Transcript_8096/g.19825 Transcript_8096/m.19825 type:complete len:225 (+) Transcript_8096:515-1189(+)